MTNNEFKAYVFEQRRQGRADSQIARSLNMSLKHLIGKLNGVDVEKVDPPKTKEAPVRDISKLEKPEKIVKSEKPKEKKTEEPKPVDIPPVKEEPVVEEKTEEKPAEDLSWME